MNHPSVITTMIDGVPAFETKDLLQRHPEDPTLWCVYGRADDQLMLSTGEKVCGAPRLTWPPNRIQLLTTFFYPDKPRPIRWVSLPTC